MWFSTRPPGWPRYGTRRAPAGRLDFPNASCTSGFAIRRADNPNVRLLVTAGHCGGINDQVDNNGQYVGNVLMHEVGGGGLDVAYLGGEQYLGMTYIGGTVTEDARDFRSARLPAMHMIFCTSGSFSGERCFGKVTATNMCVTFTNGQHTCRLVQLKPTNGQSLVQGGDSGGPVYRYESGQVVLGGTIIGGGGNNQPAYYHPYNVLIPPGWQVDIP